MLAVPASTPRNVRSPRVNDDQRWAELVLVGSGGALLGTLRPVLAESRWWPEVASVVRAVRERDGIDVVILRLLSAERDRQPGGKVTYLAEVARRRVEESLVVSAAPDGVLDEHPLRNAYAKPGGPQHDLEWATSVLAARGLEATGPAEQIKTWNLSSLWRIPLAGEGAWLKAVPAFFQHEGALIDALSPQRGVPRLLGHERGRALLAEIPGEDLFEATLEQRRAMIELLVDLQHAWMGRAAPLLALGLPDFRSAALGRNIEWVFERRRHELGAEDAALLTAFISTLDRRFEALAACGLPDSLVHGDFHSGNLRGSGQQLTLLDWSDAGVGHPLLDQAAFLAAAPEEQRPLLREHWQRVWQSALPQSDPAQAARWVEPLAAARQAVIYQQFLDHIEPSEAPYHEHDPTEWLQRAAAVLRLSG